MRLPFVLVLLLTAGGLEATAVDRAVTGRVIAEIRVHGNLLTPDEEVRRLARVDVGMPFHEEVPHEAAARLRAANRFRRVEVLKRFASLSDPTQILLVLIVDEGPVRLSDAVPAGAPPAAARRGLRLMHLPILRFEDGHGFTYGVRVARPGPFGRRSRVSVPLTWGAERRAAIEVDRTWTAGPLSRLAAGAAISRREHPFFAAPDDRRGVRLDVERDLTRSLRLAGTAGLQHVAFLDRRDTFAHAGLEIVLDTRLDPMLPGDAVYARARWDRSSIDEGPVNQTVLDARGYLGLRGGNVLALRILREGSDRPAPPYLKPMLGGTANLRGIRRGAAVGDTLVAGSVELRVPLGSPLRLGRYGVSTFVDVGQAYDKGERLRDRRLERAAGVGAWASIAFVRLNVAVARGFGGSARVHVSTGVTP